MLIVLLECVYAISPQSWMKTAMPVFGALLSFALALTVLPIIRAQNEKRRLTDLKKAVNLWLELICRKLEDQVKNLGVFIKQLEEKNITKDDAFRVVDFPVGHLLGYSDDDLRKVLYESLVDAPDPQNYVNIINDLSFIKSQQLHMNETYDKWFAEKDTDEFLPAFKIMLAETQYTLDGIRNYLDKYKDSKIKNEWWIWS